MALNITYGNDIQLRLLVTRDSAPFPIELATGVQVNIVSIFNRRIPLEFQISDGAVYVTVKALSIGTYGIEVKGLLNKFDWRTYADAAIVVTSATKAGDTSITVASDAYDVTMEVSMYVGTLPLNNGGTYANGISVLKGYFYAIDGSTYLALVNSPTTAPSEVSDEWALLARKGHDFSYSDFTPEQISALQKPATDALDEMNALKTNVETSESTRVENENTRVTNEATRVTNENTRVENENGRVESEQARATAEQARVTDENTRLDAETLRDTQEGQRVANEQQRTTDEAGRVTAENGRVSTEAGRVSAETERASAETTRVSNENTRISNEQARVTAEAGRQATLNAKENLVNKQNNLNTDGTGTKFPTVDAVNTGLVAKTDLSEQLSKKASYSIGKNIFNIDTITSGYYIKGTSGVLTANETYSASEYMEVLPNTQYATCTLQQLAFYDVNKIYISGTSPVNYLFTTPSNAKYVRQSIKNTELPNFQTEIGSYKTAYEPYYIIINYLKVTDDVIINSINENKTAIESLPPKSIRKIMQHLRNPFVKTTIKLLGDSITAGAGGTGYELTGPIIYETYRQNNLESTNWANMLYWYVNAKYNRSIFVGIINPNIKNTATDSTYQSSGYGYLLLQNTAAGAAAKRGLEFTFYGTNCAINHVKMSTYGILNIYVDGGFYGALDGYSEVYTDNQTYEIEGLTAAYHTVNIEETGAKNPLSSGLTIYLKSLRIPKTATVVNYGLSGRNSVVLYGLRATLIKSDDDIVILQIGTNDRLLPNLSALQSNLRKFKEYTDSIGKELILMSANAVTPEQDSLPAMYSHMADVDSAIQEVALQLNMEYISNYKYFLDYCRYRGVDISTILDRDGLHPNDEGYKIMYESVMEGLGLPRLVDGLDL